MSSRTATAETSCSKRWTLDNPFRQGGLSSNYVLLGTPFLQFAQRGRPHQTLFEKFREYTTPSTSYSGPRGTVAGRESSYARIGAGLIFSLVAWALLAHYVFGGANVAAGALLITSPIFWTGVIVVSLATRHALLAPPVQVCDRN